ncbi:NTP transferase domain-containing protein, partial [bacterium]|nr:NTP transferase domain-containing protein [bacterium]
MKAIILAGGFATRLWPLSEQRAKPLLPIAGKAIVSHLAESLPEDVELIISTNEQFEKSFKDWKNKHFPLR